MGAMVILLFGLIVRIKHVFSGEVSLPQDPVAFMTPTWQSVVAVHLVQTAQPEKPTGSEVQADRGHFHNILVRLLGERPHP